MKNCVILGSGRSGSSMTAGVLSKSGYFMGEGLLHKRDSNPKGFFESIEINAINEAILESAVSARPRFIGRWINRAQPRRMARDRWLARIPLDVKLHCPPELEDRIRQLASKQPFCFKDPRFSYTLPIWRPHFQNVVYVCIFRDPSRTAESIIKEISDDRHYKYFSLTFEQALENYAMMYKHILERHCREGDWLFLHYNQILEGDGLDKLEEVLECQVDHTFPDPSLRRSEAARRVGPEVQKVYQQLCSLANFREEAEAVG